MRYSFTKPPALTSHKRKHGAHFPTASSATSHAVWTSLACFMSCSELYAVSDQYFPKHMEPSESALLRYTDARLLLSWAPQWPGAPGRTAGCGGQRTIAARRCCRHGRR